MEKSGRRIIRYRSRRLLSRFLSPVALAFLLVPLWPAPLVAAEVDIFVSSFEVSTGEPVVVAFTVREANPSDTNLDVASVPASFADFSTRKERRQIDDPDGTGKSISATVITREWIPSLPGSYSIGPFTVTVNADSVTLPPVYLTVVAPKTAEYTALRWVVSDDGPKTGTPLRLKLEGYFSGTPVSVSCPAPENALLEPVVAIAAEPGSENGWITVASYDWTPLAEGVQALPMAILEYTPDTPKSAANLKLASLPRSVSVGWGLVAGEPNTVSRALGRAFAEPAKTNNPAPGKGGADGDGGTAITRPAGLPPEVAALPWKAGSYATILHNLRRAEYTRLFPARWRNARLSVEDALDLGETLPVPPAAWKGVCVIGAVLLASLGLFLKLAGVRVDALRYVSVLAFVLALLLAIFAVSVYTRDSLPCAVVTGGDLLHIPEFNSTVVETLHEGAPVRILRKAGNWYYIKTGSTLEGWLKTEQILQYTTTE